jgi:crotonobetainyl-CoA:carnitine CoA-transferase CaiB-like acyl-CoA transferase
VLVDGLVEAVTTTRPLAFWLDRLRAARLPYGEVRTIGSVVEHPQLLARRLFVQADSPVGPLPVVRFPLADPDRPRRIPALGEHTDALLAELGYGAERRDRLRRDGVI